MNLPKSILEVLGIGPEEGELIAETNPKENKGILRPKPVLKEIPQADLSKLKREKAYLLRGAIREAEEFFEILAEALHEAYPHIDTEIRTGAETVVLKLKKDTLSILELFYKEDLEDPNGVIVLKVNNHTEEFLNYPIFSKEEIAEIAFKLAQRLNEMAAKQS